MSFQHETALPPGVSAMPDMAGGQQKQRRTSTKYFVNTPFNSPLPYSINKESIKNINIKKNSRQNCIYSVY